MMNYLEFCTGKSWTPSMALHDLPYGWEYLPKSDAVVYLIELMGKYPGAQYRVTFGNEPPIEFNSSNLWILDCHR